MDTQSTGVKETRELFAAIAAILLRTKSNLADGKMSWIEMMSYGGDIPELKAALSGIKEISHEMLDIDDAEAEVLASDVRDLLVKWDLTDRLGDVSVELVKFIAEGIQTFMKIMALPPRAEKVED